MRVELWPRFFATTSSGTLFMTDRLAQVWRNAWKFTGWLIRARLLASRMYGPCMDRVHAEPVRLRNRRSPPARPVDARRKNSTPSAVRITRRGLPDLLLV